jgi:hypothetical protein
VPSLVVSTLPVSLLPIVVSHKVVSSVTFSEIPLMHDIPNTDNVHVSQSRGTDVGDTAY